MRDPKRIDEILAELARIWKENPDWRFWQLMMNLHTLMSMPRDPFYVEDNVVLDKMKKVK